MIIINDAKINQSIEIEIRNENETKKNSFFHLIVFKHTHTHSHPFDQCTPYFLSNYHLSVFQIYIDTHTPTNRHLDFEFSLN